MRVEAQSEMIRLTIREFNPVLKDDTIVVYRLLIMLSSLGLKDEVLDQGNPEMVTHYIKRIRDEQQKHKG